MISVTVAGGEVLEGMVKRFPVAKPVAMYVDCDWIDSPARPEYIYWILTRGVVPEQDDMTKTTVIAEMCDMDGFISLNVPNWVILNSLWKRWWHVLILTYADVAQCSCFGALYVHVQHSTFLFRSIVILFRYKENDFSIQERKYFGKAK